MTVVIGVQLVRNNAALTEDISRNENNIFYEYTHHGVHAEFTCELYFDRHSDLKCAVPRRRIEE